MIAVRFPYHVKFPRTLRWWRGDWAALSEWCSYNYGWGNWEYFNEHFMFRTEEDRVLFRLRWL